MTNIYPFVACLNYMQKDEPKDQNAKMIKILSGEMAIELHLQFLIRNNNTDLMILKNTKVLKVTSNGKASLTQKAL